MLPLIQTGGGSGSGGSGTVTSVAETVGGGSNDVLYTVTGSPITTSGTIDQTLKTQTANTIFSGPTNGAAASPTFRSLVTADIPNDFSTASTGAFAWAHYGQGVNAIGTDTTVGFFAQNTPTYYPLQINVKQTFRKVTIRVTTAQAASNVYVAIYNSSGNKVSGSDFPALSSASAVVVTTTLASPLVLSPGFYFVGIAEDTANVVLNGFLNAALGTNNGAIFNNNVSRILSGGNNLSGGVMPSSIGTITNRNTAGIVAILLES